MGTDADMDANTGAAADATVEVRTLRDDEWPAFFDLMEAAFFEREIFETYAARDPLLGSAETWVAASGGRLCAACQIFPKRIHLRGRVVGLGGIGSVGTHPDFERKGLATRVLRAALDDMRRRGMALSLLFTGRLTFYERIGYVSIPHSVWSVHPPDPRPETACRPFRPADLPAIRALYDAHAGRFEGACLRDSAYWGAQLRYAGDGPDDFRTVVDGNRVIGWARRFTERVAIAMEYGRAPGKATADALARTLIGLAPAGSVIVVQGSPDPELEAALGRHAARVDRVASTDTMWRVIDRDALLDLCAGDTYTGADADADADARAGASREPDDAELLARLVGDGRGVYWNSDRF